MSSPQIAVGAVVVFDDMLLMVQRNQDPASGLWSVPGGRLEHGEYLKQAVVREVREETGLTVEVGDLLGILEVVGDPHYVILDFVATVPEPGEPHPGDDVAAVAWVNLEEVSARDCTPRFVETLRGWGVQV